MALPLPNFMEIYQAVKKLLVGDRQTGDLISLLSFLESRLKSMYYTQSTHQKFFLVQKVKHYCS
jgi:hypothetical protein